MIIYHLALRVETPLFRALPSKQRSIHSYNSFRTSASQLRSPTDFNRSSSEITSRAQRRPGDFRKFLPKHPSQNPRRLLSSTIVPASCAEHGKLEELSVQVDATPAPEVVLVKVSEANKQRLFQDGALNA